eukprot:CAMPEP_0118936856 /NCGR_PEP_ID=MMETSP1169-20130426/20703_1 /TAXON_ID=36882 /ORGANISM="Pyramimonas obovata, Strain CCMP722" /LENGTH=35 /DNA_ID= /DNA_START= /DNA_END= /DNA_ORIENTATION=
MKASATDTAHTELEVLLAAAFGLGGSLIGHEDSAV